MSPSTLNLIVNRLTHSDLNKMAAIVQTEILLHFFWMKIVPISSKFVSNGIGQDWTSSRLWCRSYVKYPVIDNYCDPSVPYNLNSSTALFNSFVKLTWIKSPKIRPFVKWYHRSAGYTFRKKARRGKRFHVMKSSSEHIHAKNGRLSTNFTFKSILFARIDWTSLFRHFGQSMYNTQYIKTM